MGGGRTDPFSLAFFLVFFSLLLRDWFLVVLFCLPIDDDDDGRPAGL